MGTEMRDPPYLKGSGFHDPPHFAGRTLNNHTVWIKLGGVAAKIFKFYCFDSPILGPLGLSKMGDQNKNAAKIWYHDLAKSILRDPLKGNFMIPTLQRDNTST